MSPCAAKSALFLGGMIVVTANWFPLFRKLDATGISDWVYFQHMWEAARVALIRYGEPLLWNPFQCGGVTMWGNPQNQTYAPWFLLSLPLGTTLGLKLFVWSHALVGLVGMYVLGRREYGLTAAPAGLAAVAWSCSGAVAWDGRDGHATFFGFLLTPWILLAWRRAAGTRAGVPQSPCWCWRCSSMAEPIRLPTCPSCSRSTRLGASPGRKRAEASCPPGCSACC
jgi:hypothetical protein